MSNILTKILAREEKAIKNKEVPLLFGRFTFYN